jgi:hypothetical protein
MIQTFAHWSPILLAFAAVVVYDYIRDLRRDLRAERQNIATAWRLYENANRELCAVLGKKAPPSLFESPEPKDEAEHAASTAFRPAGIGPTAINDRELQRERSQAKEREPRFANVGVLTGRQPSESDITAAATEALK